MTQIIQGATLPITQWLNNAGRKADIASGDGWLLGFAWLDQDAPFSDYAGFDRTITLLEGPGFTLELPEGSTLTVNKKFEPAAFSGAGPIACHLLGGPCRVLNAISPWPGFSHVVQVVTGPDLPQIAPGPMVFAVVLSGEIAGAHPGDTVRVTDVLPAGAGDTRVAEVRFRHTKM